VVNMYTNWQFEMFAILQYVA